MTVCICGTELRARKGPGPQARYCSPACYRAAQPKKHIRTCVMCGAEFGVVFPSKATKTCSLSCAATYRQASRTDADRAASAAKRDAKRKARYRVCAKEGCENTVRSTLARYCSANCHYTDPAKTTRRRTPRLVFNCETCGQQFERPPGRGTGRWCSPQCNPGSRAGASKVITPVAVLPPPKIHPRWAWDEGECFCVVCGKPGERHHIVYAQHVVAISPAHAWDTRNRLGLCAYHHGAHHGRSRPLPVHVLPSSVFDFAAEVMGPDAAYEYLARTYLGTDERLEALLTGEGAA